MNSREVIKRSSERLGLSQRETRRLLKSSTETFKKTLDEGFSFTIPKLGTFFTHVRQQRRAYDLYRKKLVMLPPKRVVSFHPSTVLKDSVKRLRFDND
jgi:integration host factor subunit alpha